uniref:TetR/AcrR family transcriptional regulator n=1 Tax=Mycobacteroides chelonae TaxID=1774 RepID=UPI003F58A4ED
MTTVQRDAIRTRRALLEAAERALMAHGPQVSLEVVARDAGVSKGGLLHHFRSREALLRALCEHWIQQYDDAVARHLEPDDGRPGRFCRAHIRAAFDPLIGDGPWRNVAVQSALLAIPGLFEHARISGRRWETEMASDGLHPQRVLLISRALDGDSMTEMFDTQSDGERVKLRDLLLALTERNEPLT